jgi:hypothetical protein
MCKSTGSTIKFSYKECITHGICVSVRCVRKQIKAEILYKEKFYEFIKLLFPLTRKQQKVATLSHENAVYFLVTRREHLKSPLTKLMWGLNVI